jgi:hypothetical protein
MSTGCLYDSYSAYAFSAVQLTAWIVPGIVTVWSIRRDASGRWGKEVFLMGINFYWFWCQFVLYELQEAVGVLRPDPFCPSVMTRGFPSLAAFYTAGGGTLALAMPWLLGFWYRWSNWLLLAVWWFAPPAVLVWIAFNSWQEVLLSMGLGVATTLGYVAAMHLWVRPLMPYVLNAPPCTWFDCVDTWLQTPEQQKHTEELRELVERVRYSRSARAVLCY